MIAQLMARQCLKGRLNDLNLSLANKSNFNVPPAWMISLFRWSLTIVVLPFAVWVSCALLPEQLVFQLGDLVNKHFWSYFKEISFDYYPGRRDLVFGVLVTPAMWALSLVAFFRFNFLSIDEAHWIATLRSPEPKPLDPPSRSDRIWLAIERSTVRIVLGLLTRAAFVALSYFSVGFVAPASASHSTPLVLTRFWYAGFWALLGLGIATMGWIVPASGDGVSGKRR